VVDAVPAWVGKLMMTVRAEVAVRPDWSMAT
jgi:hypothetical protein